MNSVPGPGLSHRLPQSGTVVLTLLKSRVPLALTAVRALLAPVMVALAWFHPSPMAFGACLVLAFLSDIFDGILARRLGVATPGLRRLDSIADSTFYLAALVAAWHLHPSALGEQLSALVALFVMETARYAFDFWKFRREAAYHLWSSKIWGICLFVGFISLLVLGRGGSFVAVPIWVGILVDLEGLAVSFLLRAWKSDVAEHQRRKPPTRAQLVRDHLTLEVRPVRSLLSGLLVLPWEATPDHVVAVPTAGIDRADRPDAHRGMAGIRSTMFTYIDHNIQEIAKVHVYSPT